MQVQSKLECDQVRHPASHDKTERMHTLHLTSFELPCPLHGRAPIPVSRTAGGGGGLACSTRCGPLCTRRPSRC